MMPTTTLIVFILAGSNIVDVSEVVSYFYVDESRAPLMLRKLIEKCDGTCYDKCRDKQRQRLDAMFEYLGDGETHGYVVHEDGVTRTSIPVGFGHVDKVVTVTAIP
jgi:hypothetical protein